MTMMVTGMFDPRSMGRPCATRARLAETTRVAASKEYLTVREGPTVGHIDTDYKGRSEVAGLFPDEVRRWDTHRECLDTLRTVCPELKDVAPVGGGQLQLDALPQRNPV